MYRGNHNHHRPNPRETSNFFSSLFFLYLLPVFHASYKSDFTEDNLFQTLKEDESSKLGDVLEKNWRKANKRHKKWSLHLALFHTHGIQFMVAGVLLFFKEFQKIAFIPFAIGKLVSYFSQTQVMITTSEAYLYAGVLIICLSLERIIAHPVMFWLLHISMRMRIACCGLMYRKILRFKKSAIHQVTLGHVVNLMSNDVSRFEGGFKCLHFIWIAPIQTMLAMRYMYMHFGSTCLMGVGIFLLLIPIQLYAAKKSADFRLKTARCSDLRVKLMNEIISGIQVIKMYTWEKPFAKLIEEARRNEIRFIRLQKILWSFTHFELYAPRTAIFLTLLCLYINDETISAELVFSMVAVYDVINHTLSSLFEGIRMGADANVSLLRINEFLNQDETAAINNTQSDKTNRKLDLNKPTILLKRITALWTRDVSNRTLSDITLHITEPQLFAIIGPVGSGKTSLLHVILKELPIIEGNLSTIGKVSYYSQETWIFTGNIRQNILFGDQYDEKRYKKICQVCALETDLRQFARGDKTLVGENGKALSGGQKARIALARCIYKQADIYLLDDPLSAVDTAVGQQLFQECIKKFLGDKICVLVTHQLQFLKQADQMLILNEGRNQGCGTYEELRNSGLDFSQLLGEVQDDEEEAVKVHAYERQTFEASNQREDKIHEFKQDDQEQQAKKTLLSSGLSKSIYARYFLAGTNCFQIFILILTFILYHIAARGANYFLSYLVNTEYDFDTNLITIKERDETRLALMYQFALVIIATIVLAIFHKAYFFIVLSRVSIQLHNSIFSSLLGAKMHFFNTTPIGSILNRFSKDMGVVDEYLPTVMYFLSNSGLYLIGIIIVTSIMRPLLLIPALALMYLFYALRRFYIRLNRSVKRMKGLRRSPIFTHISATFAGLTTIRVLEMKHTLTKEFHNFQDEHTTSLWLFNASVRAFGMWLDVFCVLFITIIIVLLLCFSNDINSGELGLIITQYMGFMGSIQFGMRQWSEMETNMISVERVLEYTHLDNEPIRRNQQLMPKDWPNKGKMEFQSISMKYNKEDPPVLNRISFKVNPSEKIGIVGRTGAGKSSIITALFQLFETSGTILIDDIDVTKIHLHDLRSKISIIPQDPVLFEGTMRKNLDPFDQYTDNLIWDALDQVKLKEFVNKMPRKLQMSIAEGGINFSVGQRQLICLARAIVRKNKILVLDEATANVDPHTDELIQETIRKVFANCTVLTIAHRLHTVMDGDKILVMDGGEIAEFGTPYELLQNPNGRLQMMLQKTGSTYAKDLTKIAENVHLSTAVSNNRVIRKRKIIVT